MNPQLVANYRYHRARAMAGQLPPPSPHGLPDAYAIACTHARAVLCLKAAYRDIEAGEKRYWSRPFNQRANGYWRAAGGQDRMQWVECPADIGLRLVGYADEIDVRHTQHTGWWTDDDGQRGKIRGVVYQLPTVAGTMQFVAGYEDSENKGGPAINFGMIYRVEAERDYYATRPVEHYEVAKVARDADSLAEAEADEQREHNRAWDAGRLWREFGQEIAEAKADFREQLEDLLTTGRDAIQDAAGEFVDSIRDLINARRDLASGNYDGDRGYLGFYASPELVDAFNDGAQS